MTMSLVWLIPAALWGLAALAVPILVHLLTRQERRSIPFPSLRFLTAARLVALRHRRIHDWPLLLVRAATLAAAVTALAGPLLITPQRERAWNARTARAIVVAGGEAPADEVQTAFASRVIPAPPRLADALRSANDWLAAQPPAARELVIAGDLRVGALEEADLKEVPAHVGIRFLPDTTAAPDAAVTLPVMALQGDRVSVEERGVHLNADDTVVERRAGTTAAVAAPRHRLEVRAAPADQPGADAALAALLSEGIVADVADARHVVVQWPGAAQPSSSGPEARDAGPSSLQAFKPWMRAALERLDLDGEAAGDALVVRLDDPLDGARAVGELRRIASAAFDDAASPREPRRIPAADLARWSRAPHVAPDAVRQEEGDRRVLWALVLALLAVETVLRRTRPRPRVSDVPMEESRVA